VCLTPLGRKPGVPHTIFAPKALGGRTSCNQYEDCEMCDTQCLGVEAKCVSTVGHVPHVCPVRTRGTQGLGVEVMCVSHISAPRRCVYISASGCVPRSPPPRPWVSQRLLGSHAVRFLQPPFLDCAPRFACTRHCPAEVERGESCPACCDVPRSSVMSGPRGTGRRVVHVRGIFDPSPLNIVCPSARVRPSTP